MTVKSVINLKGGHWIDHYIEDKYVAYCAECREIVSANTNYTEVYNALVQHTKEKHPNDVLSQHS